MRKYLTIFLLALLLGGCGAPEAPVGPTADETEAIILLGEQRNPNIFHDERAQSDCIFFATALPEA